MNIIKKILFTLSIMLVWGVGKEVAQNIQGSRAGLLTLIISLVGTWVIYDIWFGSFFFSKNVKNDVNSNQKRQKIPHSFELANETLPNKNTYISDNKSISSVAIKPTDMGIDKRHVYEDDSKFDHSSNQKNLSINREISMDQISNFIDEDVIYEKIADELDSGSVSKGLWTKLFAKYDGDEVKIKAEYIRQRFSKLQKDAIQAEKNKHQKNT